MSEQATAPEAAPVEAVAVEATAPVFNDLLNVSDDVPVDQPISDAPVEPEKVIAESEFKLPEGMETNDDLLNAFNEMKERYSAPEDYELPTIEGFTFFEDADYGVGQFKDVAKDLGLNQEGFGKVMDFYVNAETQRATMDQKNREQAVYEAFGGADKAAKAIPVTSARVKSVLGADGMSVYQDAASGSVTAAASAIKLAGMLIGKLQGEPQAPVNAAQPSGMSREDLREMMKDSRYRTNPEFRAKVDAGYNKLFG